MPTRVLVLGAGFGGLEVATTVAAACPDSARVTLIDHAAGFVFGFSKLDVMFGRHTAAESVHSYSGLSDLGITFVAGSVSAIDPGERRVETSVGTFEGDVLVVALGADLDPAATPGLVEGGHEFYTVSGAFALREVIRDFPGGRVVVGVTSTPFKCPPAPSECALLMHEYLTGRGVRGASEISLVMPFGSPIPPSPQASAAVLEAFAERGIDWCPGVLVTALDPQQRTLLLSDGTTKPYDLFLGVPVHRAPQVVLDSGMTQEGWIPVDPTTLETAYPGVYAVGDVTSVGTPKAGVFSEGQAAVAAARIISTIEGVPATATYDGRGICYLEFGGGTVAKVDVTFAPGQRPTGDLEGPATSLVTDKSQFESDRLRRWFASAGS